MSGRFKWLIAVVVLVCAGWTGIWYYAAGVVGERADVWLAREAGFGRKWTCADRQIGGYPFRMLIRCKSLQFSGAGRGGEVKLSLGPVRAIAQIYNPKLILAEVDGPLNLSMPGPVRSVTGNWSYMRASLRAGKPLPQRVSVHAEKLDLKVVSSTGNEDALTIAEAELHLRPAPDVTADIGATDLALVVGKLTSQMANQLTRDDAPINASLVTRITRLPVMLTGVRQDRLERWRQAGGNATMQNSTISKGNMQIDASGRLQLDEEHRLSGTINARAAGLSAIMQTLGVPGFSSGGLLGAFLGGKSRDPDSARRKVFVPLPIQLRDGAVSIGPFRTGAKLKPLY